MLLKIKRGLSNTLVQLLITMLLVSTCVGYMSTDMIRFFLTISVCLREILVFVLPFLLFSFVATALANIPKESMFFVLALMVTVIISNFFNILVSGTVGFFLLSDMAPHNTTSEGTLLLPFFEPHLPVIASTSRALLIGVAVGFLNTIRPVPWLRTMVNKIQKNVLRFMKGFFIPLLPLFVGGFLLKLLAEGRMTGFLVQNAKPCMLMCIFLWFYLCVWLFIAASFNVDRAISIFRNACPAIITAFSTMSSASALPLSLEAATKNTNDKNLSEAVMPLTLNFHMVGDTIIVPIMAMVVLLAFDEPLPNMRNFLLFGIFFVLNKFAGGGVPSGTIMVTIPVLKEYLGFDDTMAAFIIAFYGVLDPIATSGNVAANNFFVIIFQRIRRYFKKSYAKGTVQCNN